MNRIPDSKIFPIFNFFENWCQDENRHGDFFDALMKAQPDTVRGPIAKLWCRFFLLAVFATMYVRDVARKEFYESLGLDARTYDKMVIEKTNETSARVFPSGSRCEEREVLDRDLSVLLTNNAGSGARPMPAMPLPPSSCCANFLSGSVTEQKWPSCS